MTRDPFDLSRPRLLHVSCARGLAPAVREEVEALGYRVESERATGVTTRGALRDAMRLNLHLRCAFRVLLELDELACPSADALYRRLRQLPWEGLVPADGYLTVDSRVDTPAITNPVFANQRVKDAVVDRIAAAVGRRPDAGTRGTGTVLRLSWKGERAWISLDTTGPKLSDRGYRKQPHRAPLRETLAAALLRLAGYAGAGPLVNPMCGSGTLAIEAALIAAGRAPGLLRTADFAFMHVLPFVRREWEALREEARRERVKRPDGPIVATDHDPAAVAATRHNARTAGVEHLLELAVCDFAETSVPARGSEERGLVVINPEYGKRLGERAALEATYGGIGDFLKFRCTGYTGAVFTCEPALAKRIGLRSRRRLTLYNGDLEGRLLLFDLYAGSRKRRGEEPAGA